MIEDAELENRRKEKILRLPAVWEESAFEKTLITKFPKRIQQDILKLSLPDIDIDEIESTYLYGGIGTGKTITAVQIMLNYLKYLYINQYDKDIQKKTAGFISVPELLLLFKAVYSKVDNVFSETELIKMYSDMDFLVLDDFGVDKTTDWSFQLLYIIINRRYENMKITIFTSNLKLSELADKFGDDRLTSRIQQMCKIKKSGTKNYREDNL